MLSLEFLYNDARKIGFEMYYVLLLANTYIDQEKNSFYSSKYFSWKLK